MELVYTPVAPERKRDWTGRRRAGCGQEHHRRNASYDHGRALCVLHHEPLLPSSDKDRSSHKDRTSRLSPVARPAVTTNKLRFVITLVVSGVVAVGFIVTLVQAVVRAM